MYDKSLHRFSVITAVSTFVLIFIGGLVTSTGSGLSVPDWPTTYGQNMFTFPIDKWVGGIKYEHGHRLFASFVGFLTVVLTIWIALKEDRLWVKWVSYFALGAVLLQGVLGGLTVIFLLPTAVSIAHGMLAQAFFCTVSAIALFTSKWWREEQKGIMLEGIASLQSIAIFASVIIFIQLIFGALMRHTYSGLSVPDFPLAYGQLLPSLSPDALNSYNQELMNNGLKSSGDKPVAAYQIVVHLIHRYWAVMVAGLLIYFGYKIWNTKFLPMKLRKMGLFLLSLVVVQFMLGILTILSKKEYIITSLHVVIGALVLVTCILIALQISRIRWLSRKTV